jgi:hypothetical protein
LDGTCYVGDLKIEWFEKGGGVGSRKSMYPRWTAKEVYARKLHVFLLHIIIIIIIIIFI